MTTIRLHAYKGTNDGTVSCDFRGDKFIGHKEGDEHKTLLELDVDETDPAIAEALLTGPVVNKFFAGFFEKAEGPITEFLGGFVGLRVGVWDKEAPVEG